MKTMIRIAFFAGALALLVTPTPTAHARATEHFYGAEQALTEGTGEQPDAKIPFYLKGQKHPRTKRVIGTWTANRHSRGVFRSDKASCQVAFRSAVLSLQKRARDEGGDGIIDIISVTRGQETSSSTDYRCVAGATVVHVALRGTVVKFAK